MARQGVGKQHKSRSLFYDYVSRGNGGNVNIICTQPRRLAAIGVAERVAAEQDTALGDTVGYQVRMDSKRTEKTRLIFCTTGILLRRLHGDPTVEGVTHILVDEVHERDVDTDFLLAILREVALACVVLSSSPSRQLGRALIHPELLSLSQPLF